MANQARKAPFQDLTDAEMEIEKFKLAVFDMDGVLTQPVSSWEYVHRKLGVDNTGNLSSYRNGTMNYIDFLKSDVKLWLDRLGPTSAETVIRILDEIPLRGGISLTINTLKERGIKTAIISGGIYWLAEKIGKGYGFDEIYANHIKTDSLDNLLPDGIVMVDPKHKDHTIRELQDRLKVEPEETISVGDTLQDVAMFRNSGLSVAFNPVEETVSARARFTLKGNDLSELLKLLE